MGVKNSNLNRSAIDVHIRRFIKNGIFTPASAWYGQERYHTISTMSRVYRGKNVLKPTALWCQEKYTDQSKTFMLTADIYEIVGQLVTNSYSTRDRLSEQQRAG